MASPSDAPLIDTLVNEPGRFWYFNNGITVLCQKVAKSPKGGTSKKVGHFEFRGGGHSTTHLHVLDVAAA